MLGLPVRVFGILVLSGITITWAPFKSRTYPFTVLQPSSYRHIVIDDTAGRPVDYFFPSLGSQLTNVNIYSDHNKVSVAAGLRSLGATHVRVTARILIDGESRALTGGDFHGIPGRWTIEQTIFSDAGQVWHLTASYDHRFRTQRPIMLKMLRSFKPSSLTKSHASVPAGAIHKTT